MRTVIIAGMLAATTVVAALIVGPGWVLIQAAGMIGHIVRNAWIACRI